MKTMIRTCILTLFLLTGMLISIPEVRAAATPPERMTYQGFLVDSAGIALGRSIADGGTGPANYDIVFSIWDAQSGGEAKWGEQQTVTVDKGYFSVLLGEGGDASGFVRPDLSAVFSGDASERYIQITVLGIGGEGSNLNILPRLQLVSSPYAFMATRARALMDAAGSNVVEVSTGTGINVSGSVSADKFNGFGTIPIGGIIMWSGRPLDELPDNWKLCDGKTYFGQKTPDLRDRFVVGAGSTYDVGDTGGSSTVILSIDEMPTHNHDGVTSVNGAHDHTGKWAYANPNGVSVYGSTTDNRKFMSTYNGSQDGISRLTVDGNHSHTFTTNDAGGNKAHENKPPYYALAFIMRVQ